MKNKIVQGPMKTNYYKDKRKLYIINNTKIDRKCTIQIKK